ncbi:MAG: fibronectin type III domain-containing protein, partial [Desulfosporosinus sp.]|nr:fibronectin type III domain-containing protein [Desulfosporosinus sp.]
MKKKLILITLTSLMSLMAWVMPVLANTVTSPTPVGVELTTPNSTADSPMVYGDNINYNQALTGIYFHANLAKGDTIRVKWYWQGSISDPQNGNFLTQNDFSPTNGDSNFMSGLFTAPSGAYSVQLELITGSGATDSYAYFTEVDNALGNIALFPALTPTGGGSTRGAPSPVSATDNGSGTISWPANPTSDNVTGYNVYSDGSLVATVTSPSFNYSSLPAGTHSITVTALNSLGESTPSTPVSVTSGTGSTGGIGGTGNDTGCSDVVNAVNALGSQLATIITNQGTLATDISNLGNQLTTVTDSQ